MTLLTTEFAFYADAARSSATRRAYASDMAAFSAWGGRVPASQETVASYLAASYSLAAATLRRRLAAIADAHQAVGLPDPTKHPLVRKVFRGIRRVHGARTDAATPLDIDMLARIVSALPEDLTAIRDRALLLVGNDQLGRSRRMRSPIAAAISLSLPLWLMKMLAIPALRLARPLRPGRLYLAGLTSDRTHCNWPAFLDPRRSLKQR